MQVAVVHFRQGSSQSAQQRREIAEHSIIASTHTSCGDMQIASCTAMWHIAQPSAVQISYEVHLGGDALHRAALLAPTSHIPILAPAPVAKNYASTPSCRAKVVVLNLDCSRPGLLALQDFF